MKDVWHVNSLYHKEAERKKDKVISEEKDQCDLRLGHSQTFVRFFWQAPHKNSTLSCLEAFFLAKSYKKVGNVGAFVHILMEIN